MNLIKAQKRHFFLRKRFYVTTLVAFAAFAVFLSFFTDFRGKKDLPEILLSKKLKVVLEPNPLCCLCEENDDFLGFDYELIQHYADSMGLKLTVKFENNLNKNIKKLNRHRYDIIATNLLITDDLRNKIDLSNEILLDRLILVQRADSINIIRNQLDLGKKTVHIIENSPYGFMIDNLADNIGDSIFIEELDLPEESQLLELVADSTIDYTVQSEIFAKLIDYPNLDIATPVNFVMLRGWGIRKDSPELKKSIDNFIENFKKTETYKEIYNRYYGL
jgi:membrane-bound lytic murein transglycosylase F